MKKYFLSIIGLGAIFLANAQNSFDYSNATGWSNNIITAFTDLNGTCDHPPYDISLSTAPDNRISINSTNQRVEFRKVYGAQENRISTALGVIYDKSFRVDFDFNISDDNSSSHGTGILPMALTSKNLNPELEIPVVTCRKASVMDALTVWVGSTAVSSTTGLKAVIRVWDEGVLLPNSGSIALSYNTNYYARVNVNDNETGELLIYSNTARTTLVGKFCFTIPSTVQKLNVLQHSTSSLSGTPRVTSAWVDNTIISNIVPECCSIRISGPKNICGSASGTFTVTTTGTDVTLYSSLSEAPLTANLNGSYTISNWGSMTGEMPKLVTLTARSNCKCEELLATYNVYIYPAVGSSDFDWIGLTTSGTNLTDFSCQSAVTGANIKHEWEMFYGTSNAIGASVRGPFVQTGTAGATWAVTSATPAPALVTTSPYVVRHRISYADGMCPASEKLRSIDFSNKTGLMIDLGDVTGMTDEQVRARKEEMEMRLLDGQNISIQPNPTDGKITVKATANIVTVVVMDANGRELTKVAGNGNELPVDLSAMTKGTYLLKITTTTGTYTERVVRQ